MLRLPLPVLYLHMQFTLMHVWLPSLCVGMFMAGAFVGDTAPSSRHTVPPVDVEGTNVWESFTVCMALVTFTDGFATSMVVVHCDNTSCVA